MRGAFLTSPARLMVSGEELHLVSSILPRTYSCTPLSATCYLIVKFRPIYLVYIGSSLAENITSELFCVLTRFRSGNAELLVKCLGRNFPPNATYICYKVLADYVLKIRLIYMVQGVEVSCLVPRSTLFLHLLESGFQ